MKNYIDRQIHMLSPARHADRATRQDTIQATRQAAIKMKTTTTLLLCAMALTFVAGCAGKVQPDWQMNADSSITRFQQAYFDGNTAIEELEFKRAREQVARTGNVDLVIRTELIRCATRVASLVFEPCSGYQKLRQDASKPERAYALYLTGGKLGSDAIALLPPQHRVVARIIANTADSSNPAQASAAVRSIKDPLAALIASGVLLRSGYASGYSNGHASAAVLELASATASSQGWRRPLLAWLGVQAQRADQISATDEAQRLRRRIAIILGDE
jgi:hypothetical protein